MEIKIDSTNIGVRIDKFLCKEFDISFGGVQKLIREKKIKINHQKCDASYKLQDQDQLLILKTLE